MGNTIHTSDAIVVLPAIVDGSIREKSSQQWLARADLEFQQAPSETLSMVLRALGQADITDGLAALRFWGQTGDRPEVWMAAADPVHLAAELDRLRLHRLAPNEWTEAEMRQLFDELQMALGENGSQGFVRLGSHGYLNSEQRMPTATYSADTLNGTDPGDSLPEGPAAAAYHKLLSEIQMTLHSSPVNQQRGERNLRAINSLWIWGGGVAPERKASGLLTLFSEDPLLQGYWHSRSGDVKPWQGSLEHCVESSSGGFVAITPDVNASFDEYAESLGKYVRELKQILKNGGVRQLKLLFRHGLTARVRPHYRLRFWRRNTMNLTKAPGT